MTPAKKRSVTPTKKRRSRGGASLPCPVCGKPSRVLETTLGTRRESRTLSASHRRKFPVVRQRSCLGARAHRFVTEERARCGG